MAVAALFSRFHVADIWANLLRISNEPLCMSTYLPTASSDRKAAEHTQKTREQLSIRADADSSIEQLEQRN